jgi:hypothetical protein
VPDRTDVVLHLGTGKTGTTTIQHLMRLNRPALADVGVLYPMTPGRVRHIRFGLSFRDDASLDRMPAWRRMRAQSPEQFRRRVQRKLRSEIAEAGLPRVLISDEALYGFRRDTLARLRAFTDELGGQVRLVLYLRRQDDHLVSYYQQQVKVGETQRLTEWAQGDRSSTYDYARRLEEWREGMEHAEIVVRRFEHSAFLGGSLEADFLDAAAIDGIPPTPVERKNESLGAEAVEFLRLYNLCELEHPTAHGVDRISLVNRLVEQSTGPALTLPTDTLDAFFDRWRDSNRAVAQNYFGDDELFRDPRKSSATTDEQRLDPSRVDHYVELAELPSALRDPLHQVALREVDGG